MGEQPEGTSSDELLGTLAAVKARAREREEQARSRRRHLRRAGIFGGIVLALALVAFNVVVWGGYIDIPLVSSAATTTGSRPAAPTSKPRTATPPVGPAERPATTTRPTAATTARPPAATTSQPPAVTTAPAPTPTKPAAPPPVRTVTLRITGARGDCWVEVRRRDRTGDVVYAGIVSRGASITVKGTQLWIRFGAVGNLDLVLNGKPVRPTHTGTVDAVVTPSGFGA